MKQLLVLHTRVPSDRKEEANTMDRFQVERPATGHGSGELREGGLRCGEP
jgi:hypothetical protein